MFAWFTSKSTLRALGIMLGLYLVLIAILYFRQRSMLFFPTHVTGRSNLAPWSENGRIIGYCREVPHPRAVWLMTHGNAGQALDREYVLPCLSEQDCFYVLEYPGYGSRAGTPSRHSMNQAAVQAYELLGLRYPNTPVCAVGESIGSGPAAALALEQTPPNKIVLVVPFDTLANVAASHYPVFPVRLLLRDRWNNVEALGHYAGPVEIFAAEADSIIPIRHARALARQVPNARLHTIPGAHNEWATEGKVKLTFP